jgi:CDP-glycerol glycerophosphotransferase (TagB/SpsB family)
MNLWKDKRAIVYMPTHRIEVDMTIDIAKLFNLDRMELFCEEHNCVFVVKKHFFHRNEKIVGIDKYKNIIDLTATTVDPQILLKNTDLLICDYSSAYIDYLLLDRPIIFYNYDLEEYLLTAREMYFEYNDVIPGPQVKTFDELYAVLQREIDKKEDLYKAERYRVRNIFYASNTQRVISTVLYEKINEILRLLYRCK